MNKASQITKLIEQFINADHRGRQGVWEDYENQFDVATLEFAQDIAIKIERFANPEGYHRTSDPADTSQEVDVQPLGADATDDELLGLA